MKKSIDEWAGDLLFFIPMGLFSAGIAVYGLFFQGA